MESKNEIVERFSSSYKELRDTEKEEFARICSKFLNETFVVKSKKHDQGDFYFIQENLSLFRDYFALTDYQVVFDQPHGFFYIATEEDRSRIKLNKFETILLLILRLKHYENSKTVNAGEDSSIFLDELIEKVSSFSFFHPEKKMTEYDLALKKLRRAKIIDFKGSKLEVGMSIQILPTILAVLKQSDIDLISAELSSFAKEKGGRDENAE